MTNRNAAIESLYPLYHRQIFARLLSLLQDQCEAEDLTQETFLRAYLNVAKLEPESNIFGWLYAIATHLALDALRKRKYRQHLRLEEVIFVEDRMNAIDSYADRELIHRTLAHLAPCHRRTLEKRFGENYVPQSRQTVWRARHAFCKQYSREVSAS